MEAIQGWYGNFPCVDLFVTNSNRLDKAEAVYDENGCSAIKEYSKSFLSFFHILDC
jgi:hypothetical protein